MPRLDVDTINAEAGPRLGILLERLGSPKVIGRPESGRAVCPLCGGGKMDLDLAFSHGMLKCHRCDFGGDAIKLVQEHSGLSFREAAERLGDILGFRAADDPARHDQRPVRPRVHPPVQAAVAAPQRDAEALWRRLPATDPGGEAYLRGRGLWINCMPTDLVRFNRNSPDPWLRHREKEGFVVAFPVRSPSGRVQSISLRRIVDGEPKKLCLAGCSTTGAAICRPEITELAGTDPEFSSDAVIILEGGSDTLAVDAAFSEAAAEGRRPYVWTLGAIGVSSVPGVVKAFGAILKGRTVFIGLDSDEKGEEAVPKAVSALKEIGAGRILRAKPQGKDFAAWIGGAG